MQGLCDIVEIVNERESFNATCRTRQERQAGCRDVAVLVGEVSVAQVGAASAIVAHPLEGTFFNSCWITMARR